MQSWVENRSRVGRDINIDENGTYGYRYRGYWERIKPITQYDLITNRFHSDEG